MADLEAHGENQKQPLLNLNALSENQKNQAQKAISQTFQSTAHLANLLPTGTVLAFQLLSPVLANQGQCTSANRFMTTCLLILCVFSCFILSFSDSFRDSAGNVQHGLATFTGFWVVDSPESLPAEIARRYRIRFVDFVHALMSVAIGAICSVMFISFPTTRHGIGFPLSAQ